MIKYTAGRFELEVSGDMVYLYAKRSYDERLSLGGLQKSDMLDLSHVIQRALNEFKE